MTTTESNIARCRAAIVAANEAIDPIARSVHEGVAVAVFRKAEAELAQLRTLLDAKRREWARQAGGKQLSIPGSNQ